MRSAGSSVYNYVDPVRRDTVDTGFADSNATIRFVTDNAGPWFLHWLVSSSKQLATFAENIIVN